ncbi:hypothetical protein BAMA_15200 [Bacillus manliponensis]|uniref:Spectinomycin 9-adenylyltransferase n=1 Tax=Bacillus manliponensis TaxID=574376 RepID=A0A073K094_9BACI|nr:aminoglycoside adenylyltransferase domain-containing protein [Bacillus manliponensis]KEK20749.1 hypothetical protein BAMA_15200 [Bacillus manliponensis]
MAYSWKNCSPDIKDFVFRVLSDIKHIIPNEMIGFYIHGSLAMGGFNPNKSDIDILVVTNKSMTVETKRKLAQLLLSSSNQPFPIEISFLTKEQLENWAHPCPFDFHYSEFWRERYEEDLLQGTYDYLNEEIQKDSDLAAHITILNDRGICVEGKAIHEAFPVVPRSHYTSSIMGDFQDCLENIEEDPVYCTLNMIRVFYYLKEGVIASKQEAANWGISSFPKEVSDTVQKAFSCYSANKHNDQFHQSEVSSFKKYIQDHIKTL